jgi:zinc transporter ZupT
VLDGLLGITAGGHARRDGVQTPRAALDEGTLLDVLVGGLAFAAGAMLYVVVGELIPESHARGNEPSRRSRCRPASR